MASSLTAPDSVNTAKSAQHLTENLVATAAATAVGGKGFINSIALSVAVPSITASGSANVGEGTGSVGVTVTGVALGDLVLAAIPTAALPANCLLLGAYVSATDTVTITFGAAANTGVTGASKTFDIIVLDRT